MPADVGRENLTGTEQFWDDWIALLKTKSGDTEGRLLKEAVLNRDGVDGLVKMADENCETHPSLYLSAMMEYDKIHDYAKIVEVGKRALEKIDSSLVIRSRTALMAANAASYLMHQEDLMMFCWESFRSDSTDQNFLRLFGMKEMAEKYGKMGKEVLSTRIKGNSNEYKNDELRQNIIGDDRYYTLCFYTGDFGKALQASKNPQGSLGWSSCFIRYGVRLFLLYLYDKAVLSKAAAVIESAVSCAYDTDSRYVLSFEKQIAEESLNNKTSVFWSYFQRWKQYFQVGQKERKQFFEWAKKAVHSRADALVSGKYRRHYGEAAVLLAVAAEIEENLGTPGAMRETFAEYKKKFPRHSSFQAEMRKYFSM